MAYTEKQARARAEQIFRRFGLLIHLACTNSIVEESFLAGFIGVEAGIDRAGQIRPEATRFEPHVFRRLQAVRDGLLGAYNRITRTDLQNASDDALRNLATSYGLSQIMGWHVIKNLRCSIADLRDPDKHLFYTVKLLTLTGGIHLRSRDYASVLRIWNTGSANGKTYHGDYVENALKVKAHYAQILKENKDAFKNSFSAEQTTRIGNPAVTPAVSSAPEIEPENGGVNSQTPTTQPPGESPLPPTTNFAPETFQAFIPQIDTAKRYLKAVSGLTGLSAAGAFFAGLPPWLVISLIVVFPILVIGGIVIFVKYHKEIFAYVRAMNTLRATAGVHNPVVSGETPLKKRDERRGTRD
jgi:hypothetical protein